MGKGTTVYHKPLRKAAAFILGVFVGGIFAELSRNPGFLCWAFLGYLRPSPVTQEQGNQRLIHRT
jgi:hypothetical protein